MTVEIRELVIRAVVEPEEAGSRSRGDRGGGVPTRREERDALVDRIVREVLRALRERKER